VEIAHIALLVAAGLAAGVVNTLAGGGSLLTVPLLVLLGLPGTIANGTNRVGILLQSLVAVRRFGSLGVGAWRHALPVLLPVVAGSLLGATAISRVADATFERLFGFVMLLLLVPTLRGLPAAGAARRAARPWSPATRTAVYFAIGLYGGALQAGTGIPLLFAISRSGYDLVEANAIKLAVMAVLTCAAVPVFAWQGQIAWLPAAVLAAGFSLGGAVGAQIAVRGGERVIRPVLAAAIVALAGEMLGLY
jgi:uncharacterized membrane protein YfcA